MGVIFVVLVGLWGRAGNTELLPMFNEKDVIYRYKYLPFNEGSLKTLTDGTIKFTCPLDLNDPFDCLPYYDTSNINQLAKLRPDLYKAAGDRKGLSPAKRIQGKSQWIAGIKQGMDSGEFAKNLIRHVGIVSLTRNPFSVPMWSHYADFHRGFVLEFRVPIRSKESINAVAFLVPLEVKYQANRPTVHVGTTPDDLVKKTVLTKSLDWEYECEERVIDQFRGSGIYQYSRNEILTSVIAGLRMSPDNFQMLQHIVNELAHSNIPNLKLYKVEEKHNEYKLIVNEHPRLSKN